MKKLFLTLVFVLPFCTLQAQEEHLIKAALYLSGASSEEEIPADWIERLEDARTVRVNSPHLRSGVLLTDYQVACILDYRARSGDILSFDELALVDGFSREAVEALRPFLSLASDRLPGQADTVRMRSSALVRTTLTTVGAKAKASGEHWRAGGAWRGRDWSAYAEAQWGRNRILAGDFQARWGQGLGSWTGFSLESLSTVDAFVKRATGLSPVWSFAPTNVLKGLSYEYSGRRVRAAAYAALNEAFGTHIDYLWKNGQVGVTVLLDTGNFSFAADSRWNWKGVDYVGEIAFRNRTLAARATVRGKWTEDWKWAVQGRVIPRQFSGKKYGEYGLAMGAGYLRRNRYSMSLTADASLLPIPGTDPHRFQLRVYGMWQWHLSSAWLLDLRLTERYRNYEAPRTDIRLDIKADYAPWLGVFRAEADYCGAWGFLGYWEGGHKADFWAAFFRLTGFWVNQWSARIYCYERDAPGTFSVPAYNGRGVALSLVGFCKWRLGRRFTLKAYLRAACQFRTTSTPAYTLNLQIQGDL